MWTGKASSPLHRTRAGEGFQLFLLTFPRSRREDIPCVTKRGSFAEQARPVHSEHDFIAAILLSPDNMSARLVYADWLEERGHLGGEYLRTEVALALAPKSEVPPLRRALWELIPRLPTAWRHRFEQPDLLLAPPVPFQRGWYAVNGKAPEPFRNLINLDPDQLSPDMPWLVQDGAEKRVDYAEHVEREELAALEELLAYAKRLDLILPAGFEAFARDFARRNVLSGEGIYSYFEVCLGDGNLHGPRRIADGYQINFFANMNYGSEHQCTWSLYLVPRIDWHCVLVHEIPDDDFERPLREDELYYCAPSFQAFLYRWWLQQRR